MAHLPHPSRAAVVAALGCGVLAASTLGAVTTANANTVSLSLDGEVNQVRTNASSVAEVLEDEGIDVTSRDVVTPSLDAAVQDGEVIAVRYARQVTIVVDGVERTIWTVADDVAEALSVLGLRDKRMELSVSRSMGIGRDGARLEVSTPKRVTLVVDGKSQKLVTTAVDVDELLDDEGFAVGAKDKVNAEPDALLAPGDKIVLKRTVAKTKTQNVSVGYSTVRRSDSSMYKGTSKTLRAGRNGKAVQQVRVVTFGGDEKSRKVIKRTVTRKPVSAIVAVGTKSRPVSSAPSVSGGGTWDALARCESGGNWAINTGNGYYGGLQFSLGTWRAFGGGSYASYPHQASRAQQIAIATKTRDAAGGYSPWPSCSRKLGLR